MESINSKLKCLNGLKIAAASLNQTALDWNGNLTRILAVIQEAQNSNVDLLCLPELCITGYGCEDAFFADYVQALAVDQLFKILPQTQDITVCVGLPLKREGRIYNVMALISNGELLGFYAKKHLADDGVHYEPRWFTPRPTSLDQSQTAIGEKNYPFQGVPFQVTVKHQALTIGFEICEDAWQSDRPAADDRYQSVHVLFNPNASHFAIGKQSQRERLALEGSKLADCLYVHCNLQGNEAGRIIYDGEVMMACQGQLLAEGIPFSYKHHELVAIEFQSDAIAPITNKYPQTKNEVFARATSLGLYDYLRKSRSRGCVVSLSGGADSAAVALMVHLMIEKGIRSLGIEQFCQSLGIETFIDRRHIHQALLTTVYQTTKNSSSTTATAARELANELMSEHLSWDISEVVSQYHQLIENAMDFKLSWKKHDLSLQNIQARSRAPGVWMLANLKNALLLSTSNRSEAAVGYATMDGDTAGGLAPIAGIDKPFIRQWLRWMENEGYAIEEGETPYTVPALSYINQQQPTAELRPSDQHQTDEADLMPYDVLEAIEQLAIGQKQSPAEVLSELKTLFPQCNHEDRLKWIRRFFQLWSRNQWKRERYAPAFHLDDRSLDPKTWCRFPILSGGYAHELGLLEEVGPD